MSELLYDRRMHGLGSTPLRLSVEESVGETPSLSISTQKTPKRVVTNLSTWMEAWNRALPIMAAAQPSRVIEYIKYQTFIALASERYEPEAWISYDQDLRRQLAEDPLRRWDEPNIPLFTLHMTNRARPYCKRCTQYGHKEGQCPQSINKLIHSFRPQRSDNGKYPPDQRRTTFTSPQGHVQSTPEGKAICRRFNYS